MSMVSLCNSLRSVAWAGGWFHRGGGYNEIMEVAGGGLVGEGKGVGCSPAIHSFLFTGRRARRRAAGEDDSPTRGMVTAWHPNFLLTLESEDDNRFQDFGEISEKIGEMAMIDFLVRWR